MKQPEPKTLRPEGGFLLLVLGTLYALYAARELLSAWRFAPLERLSPTLFGLWLVPLVLARRDTRDTVDTVPHGRALLGLSLSVLGQLLALNVLSQLGLVAVLSAWRGPLSKVHVLSALLWLPAAGWLGSWLSVNTLFTLRLSGVLLGVFIAAAPLRKKTKTQL